MIVVLIIAILLTIAVPQFIRARLRAQQHTCMVNLRQFEYAKELLAAEKKLPDGAPVVIDDVWPDYIKCPGKPVCPGGGTYAINPIGVSPTCTLNVGAYPHLSP